MKVDAQPPSACLHLVSSFPLSQGQQCSDMIILYPPPSPSPISTSEIRLPKYSVSCPPPSVCHPLVSSLPLSQGQQCGDCAVT